MASMDLIHIPSAILWLVGLTSYIGYLQQLVQAVNFPKSLSIFFIFLGIVGHIAGMLRHFE